MSTKFSPLEAEWRHFKNFKWLKFLAFTSVIYVPIIILLILGACGVRTASEKQAICDQRCFPHIGRSNFGECICDLTKEYR